MEKLGVILANTGSPDSPDPEDVAKYLEQFLSHPRIVPMPKPIWNVILHKTIIPKRSVASGEKYRTIWTDEGFQFIRMHERLAEAVEERYRQQGKDVLVRTGMSFGKPAVKDVAVELHEAGCDEIVVIPLYPQNAFSQAAIVHDDVRALYKEYEWGRCVSVVGDYSRNATYRNALVDKVRESGFDSEAGDRLLMSYHSIPLADIKKGDTYDVTTCETGLYIAETLGIPDSQWMVAYQSRFDKERKWLSPYVDDILKQWAAEGVEGKLYVMCPNFSVDCLETYFDIEQEMKDRWLSLIGKPGADDRFVYISALNDSEAHANLIMELRGV